jgi:hypothetical protein
MERIPEIHHIFGRYGQRIFHDRIDPVIIKSEGSDYLSFYFHEVNTVKTELHYSPEVIQIQIPEIIEYFHYSALKTHEKTDRQFAIKNRFEQLAETWLKEVAFSSSVIEMVTHPSYQQIIGMGKVAIPYILAALSKQPDHWFWALKAITGEDPVPAEDRGDIQKMTQHWLKWGIQNGYKF